MSAPSRTARRLFGLLGPLLVGLVVGAIGLEGLARLRWEDDWQDPSRTGAPEDAGALDELVALSELGGPNRRGLHRNVYHRTNSRGIRGPEFEPRPAPGTFRILVTGDSTTMGAGVLESERYSDLLADRLGSDFEVVNVGLSGLNTAAAIRRLHDFSFAYESDLFVYGFSLNDIEGPAYRVDSAADQPADFGRAYWATVREAESSPSYFHRYLIQRRLASLATGQGTRILLDNYLDNPDAWKDLAVGLDRFAGLARRKGVCGHVLIHPQLERLDASHPYLEIYQRVQQAARERGLSVTQPFDAFIEAAPANEKALWVSLFDPHPNRRGHALLAEALHADLEALPADCWTRS